jgi:hypothetical protein
MSMSLSELCECTIFRLEGCKKSLSDALGRFCYNEPADQASFGYRSSLSHARVLQMVELFQMSPQFLSSMFGEFSTMAPGDFTLHDEYGCRQSLGKPFIALDLPMCASNDRQSSSASSLIGRSIGGYCHLRST